MLYEFAVDPTCVASWQLCRFIIDHMGVPHGRMIAEFPRRKLWRRMVIAACDSHGVLPRERARIVEKLASVNTKMLRASRSYDDNRGWLDNAIDQHYLAPFHAIVARGRQLADGRLLEAEAVDESEPIWRVPREAKVLRSAGELARHVQRLLQISSEIRFVDKLFDPEAHGGKWRPILAACLAAATAGGRELVGVEYHTVLTGDRRPSLEELRRRCRRRIPGILPTGVRLRVVFWDSPGGEDAEQGRRYNELFHARYILTNRGGYRVETGLDVGEPGQHQDVSLLDTALWKQRWAELDDGAGVFRFVDELWIPEGRTPSLQQSTRSAGRIQ